VRIYREWSIGSSFEPLRDLMFLSTTKFGRTKEDEYQKPYPVLPHRSSLSLGSFLYEDQCKFVHRNDALRLAV
jgi:hypothetical protein